MNDNWKPIDSAPKDSRPLWVRGWDWGKPDTHRHYGFAHWNGDGWYWAVSGETTSKASHITDWWDGPIGSAQPKATGTGQ